MSVEKAEKMLGKSFSVLLDTSLQVKKAGDAADMPGLANKFMVSATEAIKDLIRYYIAEEEAGANRSLPTWADL